MTSLVSLLDPYHPLLHLVRTQTPGTYYHSLVVGSLAEAAALRIDADARLVHIGALYHDIGKTRRPAFFGENGLPSPHDHLTPLESAQYIICHVADGLTMAHKYRLPEAINNLIAQHHGTSLVSFFYHKALAENPAVDDRHYRYPGPRPQTREAGVLMLADIVEAAVRASQPATHKKMAAIARHLIEERWVDGELSESGLTEAELYDIRVAFEEMLQGVYHARTTYPPTVKSPAVSQQQAGAA